MAVEQKREIQGLKGLKTSTSSFFLSIASIVYCVCIICVCVQ